MTLSILTRLATLALFLALALPMPASASRIDTNAREAILLDYNTGQVLFEKDADALLPPASRTKIMTVFLAFERLADGRLRMEDEIPISEKAWRKGGSKMFVEIGSRVTVHDILRGIIVQSGNDASIALAEAIAGTEEAFADLMTQKAAEIGMQNATFRNATGWPDPDHLITARGLAVLARETIHRYPEYYQIFSEETFTYNGIKQGNRNPLLYKGMGADGLKTGHTEDAGYGLTASARRGDRRLILVVNGLESVRQRASESERLLEWGFREFDNYRLLERGEVIDQATVWLGDLPTVPLVTDEELILTMPRDARKDMRVTVEYKGPIPAPIVQGQVLARLRIVAPDMEDRVVALRAGQDVAKLGPLGRITSAIGHLIWGPSTGD
jgi:D-alanyl-D-alanine carboxypeptidase (penicillin-binding protein 5/6)